MPLLPETMDVDYQSLPYTDTEEHTVILHLATHVDELLLHIPVPIIESDEKKKILESLKKIAADLEEKYSGKINARLFKLKLNPPGRIEELYGKTKRPIAEANYDVVLMIFCHDQETADKVQEEPGYKEALEIFTSKENHYITTCKNIRKAGETHVHNHFKQGVYLLNYFWVEDLDFDFLPVWEHTGRWFVEYTRLDNSYLMKPTSKDSKFQYINHCYWHTLSEFVPKLIFKRSMRTYVLDNFTYNNAIAFPLIYEIVE